jgi:hypothetical protein
MKTFAIAGTLAVVTLATVVSPSTAKTSHVSGTSAYSQKCKWICHPSIKKARAKTCENKAGNRRLVYVEGMGVACNHRVGDD